MGARPAERIFRAASGERLSREPQLPIGVGLLPVTRVPVWCLPNRKPILVTLVRHRTSVSGWRAKKEKYKKILVPSPNKTHPGPDGANASGSVVRATPSRKADFAIMSDQL